MFPSWGGGATLWSSYKISRVFGVDGGEERITGVLSPVENLSAGESKGQLKKKEVQGTFQNVPKAMFSHTQSPQAIIIVLYPVWGETSGTR